MLPKCLNSFYLNWIQEFFCKETKITCPKDVFKLTMFALVRFDYIIWGIYLLNSGQMILSLISCVSIVNMWRTINVSQIVKLGPTDISELRQWILCGIRRTHLMEDSLSRFYLSNQPGDIAALALLWWCSDSTKLRCYIIAKKKTLVVYISKYHLVTCVLFVPRLCRKTI